MAATTTARNKRRFRAGFWASFTPPFLWLSLFYFVPLLILLSYAFFHHEFVTVVRTFTLENFREIFAQPGYRDTFVRTLWIAALVTAIDALIALPVAYVVGYRVKRFRHALTIAVLIPLWTNYLVRVFAWRIILGYQGVLNSFLVGVGILDQPSSLLLYNQFSVTLTLCYIWLPFMILPLITAFERLPRSLLEASSDLGAGGLRTFRKVTIPLISPGLIAGGFSVFSLTMGDFITPSLLGGSGNIMIGNIVFAQFGVASNWPLGAAFAVLVLMVVSVIMFFVARRGALENL